jgi:starvation-inducible DNA-binding protein
MAENEAIQLEGTKKKDGSQKPTNISSDAVKEISSNLRRLLADVFALYLKTKKFHWQMNGRQ